ncbi:unnamed protein product [Allacma fusca]|uniref:28S ribosomal protein S22, mitochondrial n=1 Tax=Allacma fusca TaxID=39272 RepID=A0A8J2JC53_9HEXA|nr:unnamed protein product [Allacma fusca]
MGIVPKGMRMLIAISAGKVSSRMCRPFAYRNAATFTTSTQFCCPGSPKNITENVKKLDNGIDKFLDPEVQRLLKSLTGMDYKIIFRRRNLGGKLHEPNYTFMTAEQLEEAVDEANIKAHELLQMPPVLHPRKPINKNISFDPVLQGLEKDGTTLLFTDITQNISDLDRLIVARESDGTLRHATWEEREKMNKIYFPTPSKCFKTPKMFTDPELLQSVLARAMVETTYDVVDSRKDYDYLRSTRHYGGMVFYLTRLRKMDRLLGFLLDNARIQEASNLVSLFCIMFPECKSAQTKADNQIDIIRNYIEADAILGSELRLRLNSYVEDQRSKEELHKGIAKAHGL